MQKLFLSLSLFLCTVMAQDLDSSRVFTKAWSDAGYVDSRAKKGINVLDFGVVGDGKVDDSVSIKKAISWVTKNEGVTVVYFPVGKYLITQTIVLPDNIILRGVSANSELIFDFSGKNGSCINVIGKGFSFQPVVGDGFIHQNTIEVSDVSQFSVGDYAEIEQKNDSSWDNNDQWSSHAIGQIVQIEKIAESRLYFKNVLRANYQSKYEPRIRKISPKKHVGIENFTIKRIDKKTPVYGNHISFKYAARCWVSGVKFLNCVQRFVDMHHSTNLQISGCYFKDAFDYGGGGHAYGCEASFHTGESLITNNIFEHLRHSMLVQAGANGNVFSYNYSFDPHRSEWPHDYASDLCLHGNYPFANLFEGNIVYNAQMDNSHGISGHLNTLFRNSIGHYGFIMTSNTNQQNILANDITDAGRGLFILLGKEHQSKGNRKANIWGNYNSLPKNSTVISKSLYLKRTPKFWGNSLSWPSIGPNSKESFSSKQLPARERLLKKGNQIVVEQREVEIVKP
ncbi:glycosyl hydrolase family 28-related protein [Candidatus Uabimicrobium sp. HlEnr_7]|uniref:glycosyl hydrolase family 28-related protein n=1 Tax=Candidatus Uabimicrobium helgolandensis TaxID=3095367 RepID=UPI00355790DE